MVTNIEEGAVVDGSKGAGVTAVRRRALVGSVGLGGQALVAATAVGPDNSCETNQEETSSGCNADNGSGGDVVGFRATLTREDDVVDSDVEELVGKDVATVDDLLARVWPLLATRFQGLKDCRILVKVM